MTDGSASKKLLGAIPPPRRVREALGETLRDAALLRRLLRLAEKRAGARRERKGVDYAR